MLEFSAVCRTDGGTSQIRVNLETRGEPGENSRLFEVSFDTPSRVVELSLAVNLRSDEILTKQPNRSWRRFDGGALHWASARYLMIRRANDWSLIDLPWASQTRVHRRTLDTRIVATLIRKVGCGLGLTRGLDWSAARTWRLPIIVTKLESPNEVAWLEPLPRGAPAALCLTDHADFDDIERWAVLGRLFARHGVRFTKSVFPVKEPRREKQEPGLDVAEFRSLMQELHTAGNEIAFHGIGPRYQTPSPDEFRRRAQFLEPFSPRTWIDHGSADYLFSRECRLPDGGDLRAFLGAMGVRNYWSYMDVSTNPARRMSIVHPRSSWESLVDIPRLVGRLGREAISLHRLAYFSTHVAKQVVGDDRLSILCKRPWSVQAWAGAVATAERLNRLRRLPIGIYDENGATYAVSPGSRWIFDTVLLNYPSAQLNHETIIGLERTGGVALVHCYLCLPSRKVAEGCFAGGVQLHPRFEENVSFWGDMQRQGRLALLPFDTLRTHVENYNGAFLRFTEKGWQPVAVDDRATRGVITVAGTRAILQRIKPGTAQMDGNVGVLSFDFSK